MGNENSNYIISLRSSNAVKISDSEDKSYHGATYLRDLVSNPCTSNTADPYSYNLSAGINPEKWLGDLIEDNPSGQVLVFIHGYHNCAPSAITRYLSVKNAVSERLPEARVICFDWASSEGGYREDQKVVEKSAPLLIDRCLNMLMKAGISGSRIHILTHSMGGYLLQNAFCGEPTYEPIANVLMAQADVLEKHFSSKAHSSALPCLLRHTRHLTVYWSSHDLALATANSANMGEFKEPCNSSSEPQKNLLGKRLGKWGLESDVFHSHYVSQLSNVDYSCYYSKEYSVESNITAEKKNVPSDTHVWPLLGTTLKPRPNGDEFFMDDLVAVISGQPNIHRKLIDDKEPNNWKFKIRLDDEPSITREMSESIL